MIPNRNLNMLLMAVFLTGLLVAPPSFAGAIRIRIGHDRSLTHGVNIGLLQFKQAVETRTNRTISLEIIPESALGEGRSLLEQVLMGNIQMAVIPLYLTLHLVPQAAVLELPFQFHHRHTAYRMLDGEYREVLFDLYRGAGLPALAWVDFGGAAVVNARRPLYRPEDFRGLRINGPESPLFYDTMSALQAVPGSLRGNELAEALEKRDVNALLIPLDQIPDTSLKDTNRFVTVSFQTLHLGVLVINNSFWKELAPKFRSILREAAYDFEIINRGYQTQQEIHALRECLSKGLNVVYLSFSDRRQFRDKMNPVYENWRHILGPEWFDAFASAVTAESTF